MAHGAPACRHRCGGLPASCRDPQMPRLEHATGWDLVGVACAGWGAVRGDERGDDVCARSGDGCHPVVDVGGSGDQRAGGGGRRHGVRPDGWRSTGGVGRGHRRAVVDRRRRVWSSASSRRWQVAWCSPVRTSWRSSRPH